MSNGQCNGWHGPDHIVARLLSHSMNRLPRKASLMLILAICATGATAQSSYDLRSPGGRIEVRIRTANGLRYDVVFQGRTLLQDSTLSLNIDHKMLRTAAKVLH